MKKVFIYDRSCESRKLETNKIYNYFIKNGYEILGNPKNADIILMIACAVTNNQAEGSLAIVKKLEKYNKELIVIGCLPAIDKTKLDKIFDGKTIITKNLLEIDKYFPENKISLNDIEESNYLYQNPNAYKTTVKLIKYLLKIKFLGTLYNEIYEHVLTNLYGEMSLIFRVIPKKESFYIKISTGCKGNCSYCAIKKAIGSLKSKTLNECIKEFVKGLEKGHDYFIIDGDDTGAFGLDKKNDNFPKLLEQLSKYPKSYKIVIRNLHPEWIVKYINELELILKNKKIYCIESAIQSGNERILKIMRRYSNLNEMKKAYIRIRKSFPEIILTTDCIIGFPSESTKEFNDTLNFINDAGFNAGFIIPYSKRSGTEAEKIEPKISSDEMSKRLKNSKQFLIKHNYKILNKFNQKRYISFEKN